MIVRPSLWLAAASPCFACQPQPEYAAPELFPVEYVRDNVEIGTDPTLPVCGRSLQYVDDFVQEYVDRSLYGEFEDPIRYYYLSDEFAKEVCGGGRACARGGRIYSPSLPHPHELVHAIRQRQGAPNSLIFLEEGIAQLHNGLPHPRWPTVPFALADMLDYPDYRLPVEYYAQAGHLLSFVRHRYSWEQVEALLDAAVDADSEADLDNATAATLGVDLSRLEEEYFASYPRCPGVAWTELIVECSAPPLPWSDDGDGGRSFTVDEQLQCDHPQAFGPLDGRVWLTYTVNVTQPGLYRVRAPAISGMLFEFAACDTGCDAFPGFADGSTMVERTVHLNAGLHVIRVSRLLDNPGPVAMQLEGPM